MKIPKARKLKSGNWFIHLRLGGENIPVTSTLKRLCEIEATRIKSEYLAGVRKYYGGDITVRQAVDKYIKSRDNVLSPATMRGYDTIHNNRFTSVMDKRVKDVKDWQSVCNEEALTCSAKTLKNAWALLVVALAYSGFARPTVTLAQVAGNEHPWLEPEQLQPFLDKINGDPCEAQIILAMHSLRLSEVLQAVSAPGMVDAAKNTITVHGAIVPGRDNKLVQKKENKSGKSRRVVPILIPRLLDLCGSLTTYHPNTIRRHINSACRSLGYDEVGVHGLRHSFASLCYHMGLSERETMELGGWSDVNTMRKIYTHLAQRDVLESHKKLASFFSLDGGAEP